MQEVNQENWENVTKEETAIIQFSAQWCGPCKNQAKIMNEVETGGTKAFFGKIDIEEEYDLASSFKVQSVPTIIVLKNGKESERFTGLQTKQRIQELVPA